MSQPRAESVDNRERERLFANLIYSFEEEPVEDGMDHPAEGIITEATEMENRQHILVWLSDFCKDTDQPSFAASLLRCLGRLEDVGTHSWRAELVRAGLSADDVEIRDAAVQAAELWGDAGFIDILNSHNEPEPWLRGYIVSVVGDLSG